MISAGVQIKLDNEKEYQMTVHNVWARLHLFSSNDAVT